MVHPVSNLKGDLNNLLPYDGEVYYYKDFLRENQSSWFYQKFFENISWKRDEYVMFGKKILTKRMVAWYGEKDYAYTYSKKTRVAMLWNDELLELKSVLENRTGENFNTCLLNLYPEGSDGMGWHSDDEKELRPLAAIASVSLGRERKFSFKHKVTKESVSIQLENGSLLLMKGLTQKHWLHQLPKTKKIIGSRINLTFRSIIDESVDF